MDGPVFIDGQLAAIAAAWAVLCWFVLGWRLEDVRGAATRWVTRLQGGVQGVADKVLGRLGLGAREQQGASLSEVSEMIDVVGLGLTAGLSFDAALALYCGERESALARRMDQARLCWQMGAASREGALLAAARDLDVRALETFAVSVGQALALGAPLADTLASQGSECRAAHRAEVERRIEQAPVKLLIPTGTLILPALLLSILGPLLAAADMI